MTRFPICPIRTAEFPKLSTRHGTRWGGDETGAGSVNQFRASLWPYLVLVADADRAEAAAWCYENIGPKLMETDDDDTDDGGPAYWTAGRWDYLFNAYAEDWATNPTVRFWFESQTEAAAFRLVFGKTK